METKEQDGIADVTEEDVEQDHVERVIVPATSRGLPSVSNDFQPFEGENHLRSWRLPFEFGSGPGVEQPRSCTNTFTHTGHGENWANAASDSVDSFKDQWDLPFLIFEQFFTKEVMETLASKTNIYAWSKNAGFPQAVHQTFQPWKETSPSFDVRSTRVDEYWTTNGE